MTGIRLNEKERKGLNYVYTVLYYNFHDTSCVGGVGVDAMAI